jgi:hypothetical protein
MQLPGRLVALRRHLDLYLFPDSPPRRSSLRGWRAAGLVTALLALAVILQLARIGWTGSLDTLWAEDGPIFLQGAVENGFFNAITTEYAGYLVLGMRLIGEVGAAVPLRDAPAAMAIASATVVALSGLAVWYASAGHISSPLLRGVLAALTVFTTVGGTETIVATSNVLWFMLVACFWLLLWRPRSGWSAALGGLFIALTALSTPGTLFFLPLALLRAIAVRDRRDLTIVGAYFGANAIQLFAIARSSYEGVDPVWTGDIWSVLLQRVVDGTFFGLRLGGELWVLLGWPFLILLTAAAATGLVLGLRQASPSVRYLAALTVPIALLMFVVAIYQRAVAEPMLWHSDNWIADAGRYAIVPVMLLLSLVLAMVDRSWRGRSWADRRTWLGLGLTAVILLSALVSLPARSVTGRGSPPWSASMDQAERTCVAKPGGDAVFAISPPGFTLQLHCSTVLASSDAERQR